MESEIESKNNPIEAQEERKKKIYILVSNGLLFGLVALALAYGAYRFAKAPGQGIASKLKALSIGLAGQSADEPAADEPAVFRVLDGMPVESGRENIRPVAVMIDNHRDAWPQAGLAQAQLVFEAEAEGGLNRYMAVFSDYSAIERIGPVRSARPYFVDWAREFGALYAHVGGSPDALAYLAQDNIPDINEFYNGPYFWRDRERFAPHNVFTSGAKLGDYISAKNLGTSTFFSWLYKDDALNEARPATSSLAIDLGMKGYEIEWRYDRANNSYVRYLGGKPHRDESGAFLAAKNIVVQVIPATVLDEKLRLGMDTTGEGEAMVCRDGHCGTAIWRKNSASARTRYYGQDGSELSFNRGTTWVEVVRPETGVAWTK